MDSVLLFASALITIFAVVPYIVDVVHKKTKPRIVSWFLWTLLMVIAAFAAFASGAVVATILAAAAASATGAVVVVAYKNSDKSFTKLDILCFIGALIGLVLWWQFNSPLTALIASILIDFIAAVPTIWHAWKNPQEETAMTFALSMSGALLALIAVWPASFTYIILPLYLVCINATTTSIILLRPYMLKNTHKRVE